MLITNIYTGLFRLDDKGPYVLVKQVHGDSYSAESFPTKLGFNRAITERLRELSETERRAIPNDPDISSWLNSRTTGNPELGEAVARSLETRTTLEPKLT